ncbi:MAG: type II secretion system protein [Planctomycetota bacterium]
MSQAMMNQTACNQTTRDQTTRDQTTRHPKSMTASRLGRRLSRTVRGGFTLVEILVVIVIIGILVGIIVPGVMSAYRRSQEFAIENDINQLGASLEAFKSKYGFYPPDFAAIRATNGIVNKSNLLLPYINRIAPNHGEAAAAGSGWPSGYRRIDVWMEEVGQHLGPDSALVFWLSGLIKNKQFPLTYVDVGNKVHGQVAYNGGPDGTVEREIYFDFKNQKLVLDPTTAPVPNAIARFTQTNSRPEYYVYFETKSLVTFPPLPACIVNSITVTPYVNSSNQLFNKNSFQVLAPGMDGVFAASGSTSTSISGVTPRERDNVTNFSEGRLERSLSQ